MELICLIILAAWSLARGPARGQTCTLDTDFESGAGGWTQGADSCTTGSFIVGTPDATAWQVGGGNPGQAFFTANNPGGIGSDDVDGGTCEALSPSVNAGGLAAVSVSLDYFHGQRDDGDDDGDGFSIEVLNDGVVVDTLVSIGDVTNNPAWTSVSTTVANPGTIQVRVRASDAPAGGDIVEGGIDNVQICPATPLNCTVDDDFESGTAGWINDPASTCTTGVYVVGNPTNPGGGQQIVGSHSGTTSIFTAVNTTAGTNDVDGGNCILGSPSWSVGTASTLSVWYWHGQRDNADDPNGGTPNGDFFLLEYSTDDGTSWTELESNGDAASNAEWTETTAPVPADSDVRVRAQCSDGSAAGDLVECGIDDVSICQGCRSDADCDDRVYCNGVERCVAEACIAGDPPCDDGVSCTVDCNEATDSCDFVPDDTMCDNWLFCDGAEFCDPVLDCQSTPPPCPSSFCDEVSDVCASNVCDSGPRVTITSPVDCPSFRETDVVTLTAVATDPIYGDLSSAITWSSDIDGDLDLGSPLTLSVGSHAITASVTNPDDLSHTDYARITILADLHVADFENGLDDWSMGADTCSSGSFTVGSPIPTTWQAGPLSGNAFFTGVDDDVDSGTCEALSPTVNANGAAAVQISLDYFHGQRDAGDDVQDGFTIEVLNDGLATTLVQIADVTSMPHWNTVTTSIINPGMIQLRVRATDGTGGEDIIEAGIDNVRIWVEPVCPCVEPGVADLKWRQVALKNPALPTCPAVTGWNQEPAFGTSGDIPQSLRDYCLYTLPAGIETTASLLSALDATLGLQCRHPIRTTLGGQSGPCDLSATEIRPVLTERFIAEAGGFEEAGDLWTNAPVRLAFLDTAPTRNRNPMCFLDDNDPGCTFPPRPGDEPAPSLHGPTLGAIAKTLLCGSGASCEIPATSRLTLPYIVPPTDHALPEVNEFVHDGHVGTRCDLAKAMWAEAAQWQQDLGTGASENPFHGLVLNLAVGWRPRGGEVEAPASEMALDTRMVHDTLQELAQGDAVVIAATGNRADRTDSGDVGPLLPAAWESRPVDGLPPDAGYRPLIYAASAIDGQERPLINSRPASLSPLVAYGAHAVVDGGREDPMHGTSVSTTVVAATTTALWSQAPTLSSAELMERVYDVGDEIRTEDMLHKADFCLGFPAGEGVCRHEERPVARKVSVCQTLTRACEHPDPDLDLDCLCESTGTCPICADANPNRLFDLVPPGGCLGTASEEPPSCSVSRSFPGLSAEPWTMPQPSSNLCPNCVYEPKNSLYVELDDLSDSPTPEPFWFNDLTLTICDTEFRLVPPETPPGPGIPAGTAFSVLTAVFPTCVPLDPELSATVFTKGSEDTRSVNAPVLVE